MLQRFDYRDKRRLSCTSDQKLQWHKLHVFVDALLGGMKPGFCTARPVALYQQSSFAPNDACSSHARHFRVSKRVHAGERLRSHRCQEKKYRFHLIAAAVNFEAGKVSKPQSVCTREEFDARLLDESARLCLVGMSNCGKSHWSAQLKTQMGFALARVDDEIEKALGDELEGLGYSGIDGLAEWMGYPTDERFARNQKIYLDLEERVTAAAAVMKQEGNYVLDTTGSVIYLSDETLENIRANFLVIHLEASDDMMDAMIAKYFQTPKPVVWGNSFNSHPTETVEEALRRCYPELLKERRKLYSQVAHIAVPGAFARRETTSLSDFTQYIRSRLL